MSLRIDQQGPIVHVTLDRPDLRNAFDEDLIARLTSWAQGIRAGEGTRIAVLSGAGKVFCAGADLTWMSKMVGYSEAENIADARTLGRMLEALNAVPVPLIGRVHGAALGGGAGLAAVCDIVIAAENAVFGFTEAKLGILPAVISPFVLAKIGQSAARELFLTAARFSATRAKEIGLVHAVVPEGDLDATVDAYVRELLTSAPAAIAAAKALIPRVAGQAPVDVGQLTAETIARHRVSHEGQDGMRAFLDKRKARWVP
jgi:methylglutaconyl-CoA hydratase